MLVQQGPLVIDPVAETLTYRRHMIPFSKLGLVRIKTTKTLFASVSSEGGSSTKLVDVEVVTAGDFCLNPRTGSPDADASGSPTVSTPPGGLLPPHRRATRLLRGATQPNKRVLSLTPASPGPPPSAPAD